MALIHAFLVITLRANQIVSGLALTIFAARGLSSYLANDLEPRERAGRRTTFTSFLPQGMRDAPVVGPILFDQNALVYLSWVCVVALRLVPRAHAARA